MYPVSDKFLTCINSDSRKQYYEVTISTKNGAFYRFDQTGIVRGSGYINRKCCSGNDIELGSVYASELGITLWTEIDRYTLEEATVRVFYHLYTGNGVYERIPMGVFEIAEANRRKRTIEIKAYDYMLKFDKPLTLNASSGTAYEYLLAACTECKVKLALTKGQVAAFPNGTVTLGIYNDNDMESWRDLLYYVSQVLGCFCQMNRDGELELIPYTNQLSGSISDTQRFESSYSDFETKYTAVSSTNMKDEQSEYYALEEDNGLTMNLGVNPLLQFGLRETRKKILGNILNAIKDICYVPFDAVTIGNPAYDPGDVVRFVNGHADAGKLSCITEITYRINGKHTLKGAGKNPRLSGVKSKSDKNIAGLLNRVSGSEMVLYTYENISGYTISGNGAVCVVSIDFVAKENTVAWFCGQILFEAGVGNGNYCMSEIQYRVNDSAITTFRPRETHMAGEHTLNLFLPIPQVIENTLNRLDVYMKITDGTASIPALNVRAILCGRGLAAAGSDWNGRISLSDTFEKMMIATDSFAVNPFTDQKEFKLTQWRIPSIRERFSKVSINEGGFAYREINERLTLEEVVCKFTVDKDFPPEYDPSIIVINDEYGFEMKRSYTFLSEVVSINSGQLQCLDITSDNFCRIEEVGIEKC